jgi:hypothetical protein
MEENKRPILLAGWQKDFLETVQKKAEEDGDLYVYMPRHSGLRQVEDLTVYRGTYIYETPEEELTPLELELKKKNFNCIIASRANGKSRLTMWNTLVVCYGEKEATKMWKELEVQLNE